MSIRIELATDRVWSDVRIAFGPRASNADSCWCQRFRTHDSATNEDALRTELRTAAVPIGLLAYLDDQPVGWTRVVPRNTLPGVSGNSALQRLLEDDPAGWWVTCVNLRREARGRGIGAALLKAAADHAHAHGATVVDGHPVDTAKLTGKSSPSALFTGTLSMFAAAGFHEFGRTYPSRPVMRHVA
jgi:GNAT superfamily N-acetyltransferase